MGKIFKFIGIVVGIFLICALSREILYYSFVLTGPQRSYLTNEVTIRAQKISVNNIPLALNKGQWTVTLYKPRKYLSGANEITFLWKSPNQPLYVSISVCPNVDRMHSETFDIVDDLLVLGIQASTTYNKSYLSTWSEQSIRCAGMISGSPRTKLTPEGAISIYDYSQTRKHLTLIGNIPILKTSLLSGEDILPIEINELDFSIDSPVIYEWSNKAGDAWRL